MHPFKLALNNSNKSKNNSIQLWALPFISEVGFLHFLYFRENGNKMVHDDLWCRNESIKKKLAVYTLVFITSGFSHAVYKERILWSNNPDNKALTGDLESICSINLFLMN